MKKLIIAFLVLFSFLILVDSAEAALTCQVRSNDCQSGETIVFKMSDTTNAHAELPGQTNYNYYVCCSGITDLGNDCGATNKATVLRLSSVTNAHVERNDYSPQNYFNEVCLSAAAGPALTCSYNTNCSNLGADYVCLASISGDTNAHVGNCTAYSTKVCCAATAAAPTDPTVTTQPAFPVGVDSATLNMSYTVGDYSPVEVRFNWKKTTDATWTNTVWVSRSVDGNYDRSLSGLDASTEYQFKAQLRYNGTEIEGDTLTFTTSDIGICQYHNVWGWAWSENIGWISFSCKNCDTDIRPVGCPTGNITNYGVDICTGEPSDPDACIGKLQGVMVGYAWSENIGWISFNEDSLAGCPSGSCIAEVADNGIVSGWARACAVFLNPDTCQGGLDPNRGGWDGWIKLRGTAQDGSPYGTWIDGNENPAEFRDWAWSDMVIGSISFNCKEGGYDEGTGSYDDVCSISPYKVMTDFPFEESPNAPDTLPITWDDCGRPKETSVPIFSWTYSHPDGIGQKGYHIKVYNEAGDEILDHPNEELVSTSYKNSVWAEANLDFGETEYFWKVKVLDVNDNWSDWSAIADFQTRPHAHPWVGFNWTPLNPTIDHPVQFCSIEDGVCSDEPSEKWSECFSPFCDWEWSFPGIYDCEFPLDDCEEAENPFIDFNDHQGGQVELKICDPTLNSPNYSTTGGCCDKEKEITLRPRLPKYIEVAPF